MPILLVLAIAATCLPVPWPAPPAGFGPWESLALTLSTVLAPLLAAASLSLWVQRAVQRNPDDRSAILARYSRLRRLLGLGTLGLSILAVVALGWGWTVTHWFLIDRGGSQAVLAPGAELLVPAPYFVTLFLGWVVYFPAERALHRALAHNSESPREFWSLPGFVFFHLRQFLLLVGVPVAACVSQQGLARFAPEIVRSDGFQILSVAFGLLLFILLPRIVKPALGLCSLPVGPLRERLEASARRLGVRYSDLLLWPTRGAMANAMVVGVVPWARYIIFTDRLLEGLSPDELEAVLGHEAGHVRHGHIPYYAAFLVLSAGVATAGFTLLGRYLEEIGLEIPPEWSGWLTVPPLVGMGFYIFVVFGLLSRRCERQADVFGCRAGSCDQPDCLHHAESTLLVPQGKGICRSGVLALVRALDRVAYLNGMDGMRSQSQSTNWLKRFFAFLKSWQHGPVHDRIEFLLRLSEEPKLADQVDRRVKWFRRGLLLFLGAALGVLGSAVGWADLWHML